MRSPSGTAVTHGLPSGVERRLDRRVGPVQPLVALFLPAFGRDVLVEVALRIHEADADERHAEVAGFLAVIAGEHAEAAGVDRQRLVQRELGGEVGDRLAAEVREPCRAHQVLRAARAASSAGDGRGRRARRNSGSAAAASSCSRGIEPQHPHRVVRGRAPQRVVEAAEHLARLGVPAPPEVDGEFVEAVRCGREAGGSVEYRFIDDLLIDDCGSHAPTSDANRERSMLPPETTATTLPRAGAAAERGGDRAAGGAFGDDVRALGRPAHRRARRRRARRRSIRDELLQQRPHRRQHRLAAGAVDERRLPVVEVDRLARPRARPRAARRSPARRRRRACRAAARASAAAMPASRPPPPSGATMASTSGRSSRISRPAVPLPAMNRSSSNGCTKWPRMRSERVRFDGAPALVVGGADDRRAEPLDGADLGLGRRVHHHHRAAARRPARAANATPCAALPALTVQTPSVSCRRRQLADGVVGAADLERADRLQDFELQVELAEPAASPAVADRREPAACGSRRRRPPPPRRGRRRAGHIARGSGMGKTGIVAVTSDERKRRADRPRGDRAMHCDR